MRWLAWFAVFGAAYLLAIASTEPTELIYAAIFGLCGTLLVAALHRADRRSFGLSLRAIVLLVRRAATSAVKETWLLLGPRLRAQLAGTAPDGRFIRLTIDGSHGDPQSAGRVAGVLWAQSFTPNSVPLFIDRGAFVLHQLVRRREPHADDPEFPT